MKKINHPALLAQRRKLASEYARVEAIGPATENEISKLLDASALDDPKVATRLAELRTRLELVPKRLTQIQAQIEAADRELDIANAAAVRLMFQIGSREGAELQRKIHAGLKVFIPDVREDDGLIGHVYQRSAAYAQRIASLTQSISRFATTPPDEAAAQLADLGAKLGVDLSALPASVATDQEETAELAQS